MNSLTLPKKDRIATIWRSLRIAAWLGWQIESNWADPFLFTVYSIVKPLSAAGILVVMYSVITNANYAAPTFAYIYLGNAFYMFVGAVMTGVSWAIIDDREHYRTLKYIYAAPVYIPAYLFGRGVARMLTSSLAVGITIIFGVLFLQVPIQPDAVQWALLIVGLLLGLLLLAFIGLLLAGITLMLVRHEGVLGEAVAGALYVFSGAVFPLEVLPAALRPIGFLMPITYWLELMRRALVPGVAQAFPTLAAWSNGQLIAILLGMIALFGTLSLGLFGYFDAKARERGLIDRVTNY